MARSRKIIIPTKIVMSGDIQTAKADIGFARLQMGILENQMRFRDLQQGSLTRRSANGSVIECWSCFGLRQINITAPGGKPVRRKKRQFCFCNGCVALGVIAAVHDITFYADDPTTDIDNLCYDRVDDYAQSSSYYCGDIVYDVDVCNEHFFVRFLGVMATDNTPYCIGQQVLVAPFPVSTDSEAFIDQMCYSSCGNMCFAGGPAITVAILPIDASMIPKWMEHHGR